MMDNLDPCDLWESKDEEKVNHPSHYQGAHECIEEIKAMLTPEEYRGFLKGTFLKYRYRKGRKDGNSAEQDESKAEWYMDRLMKEVEKDEAD